MQEPILDAQPERKINMKFYGIAKFPLDIIIPGKPIKHRSNVFPNNDFDDY